MQACAKGKPGLHCFDGKQHKTEFTFLLLVRVVLVRDVTINAGCLCPVSTEQQRFLGVIFSLFIFTTTWRWPANILCSRGQRTSQSKDFSFF